MAGSTPLIRYSASGPGEPIGRLLSPDDVVAEMSEVLKVF
jgi:hypothetical protein